MALDDTMPDDPGPGIPKPIMDRLAELGELADRGRRQRRGERLTLEADGSLGGLGAPPGQIRDLLDALDRTGSAETPEQLEHAKARMLEHATGGEVADAIRSINWQMLETHRRPRSK